MNAPCFTAAAIQQHLTTQTFGQVLHLFSQTSSTNDIAKSLAQQGACEGTVVLADQQTQGRGRQGRTFISPAGGGIYLSLLLWPQVEVHRLPQLTLLAAVAVAETITNSCNLPVILKWPNDVLLHGKKIAGILTEGVWQGTALRIIIGIGINVNTTAEQWPEALRPQVSSLALESGRTWSRSHLIALLLGHLERLYHIFQQQGIAPILPRWLHFAPITGRPVHFVEEHRKLYGTVTGLDSDGALLVQGADKKIYRIIAGEVIFLDNFMSY